MRRLIAAFTIVALLLSSMPASARRIQMENPPLFMPGAPIRAVENPCDLSADFSGLHGDIQALAAESHSAAGTALGLRIKSRWRQYKMVEDAWADVSNRSIPTLDELARFPSALDTAPDGDSKQAALTLTSAYQNAIAQIVDYAHNAVYYERTQNLLSARSPLSPQSITYSRPRLKVRTFGDMTARQLLDGKVNQIQNALDSLKIPEYTYGTFCRAAIGLTPVVTEIADPCALTAEFLDTHATLRRFGEEAIRYGDTLPHLRNEMRSRPFVQTERMWYGISDPSNQMLDRLSNLPLSLMQTPDDTKKQATLDLITAYQGALERIVDYAHFVVYEQRVENQQYTSANIVMLTMSFRILSGTTNTKVNQRNLGRSLAFNQINEARDALRLLDLPEYRYAKACHAPLGPPTPIPVSNPCLLSDNLMRIHDHIALLGERSQDAGNIARRMKASSLRRPYQLIDRAWRGVWTQSQPVLDTLSQLPIALEDTPDSFEKEAALDLAADYQNAVTRIVDFAHVAEFYRDTHNAVSWNFRPGLLGFGTHAEGTRSGMDNNASNQLEQRFTEVNDAFRSLKLPEYRYGKLCRIAFSRLSAKVE